MWRICNPIWLEEIKYRLFIHSKSMKRSLKSHPFSICLVRCFSAPVHGVLLFFAFQLWYKVSSALYPGVSFIIMGPKSKKGSGGKTKNVEQSSAESNSAATSGHETTSHPKPASVKAIAMDSITKLASDLWASQASKVSLVCSTLLMVVINRFSSTGQFFILLR